MSRRGGVRPLALLLGIVALGCGRKAPDPKQEGHQLPIEITEEHPVDSTGTAKTELPPQ